METIKLTPSQRSEWDKVMTAQTMHTPAFNHLMYSLLDRDADGEVAVFTDKVPMAATDGKSLIINPTSFFGADLDLSNRLFINCHEILHNVFEHIVISYRWRLTRKVAFKDGTTLPYDPQVMNMAMDYIVNAVLIAGKIGKMPTGRWEGLYDPAITIDGDADLVDVYRKVYKQQKAQGQSKPCNGGQGGSGQGQGQSPGDDPSETKGHGGGFCQHEALGSARGKGEHDTAAEHNPQAVQTAIAAAANAAKLMGKLPAGLERILGKMLEPKVNWREHIQALLMRKAGSGGYNWQQADEELFVREIFAPSRSGHGIGTVVCAIDTSGSIGQAEYDLFFGEVSGILSDLRPRRLVLIACDAKVHSVDDIDDPMELMSFKLKGGGGTSFVPVFDEIDRLGVRPDCLLYLTDGLGEFPEHAPDYHTIWGSIYEPAKYPFGDVVQVPRQAA